MIILDSKRTESTHASTAAEPVAEHKEAPKTEDTKEEVKEAPAAVSTTDTIDPNDIPF